MDTWHLKDFQAAGFAGCFMEESGCDPGAYNAAEKSGRFKGSSANGSGYGAGLAQWSNAWKRQIQRQFHNFRPIENWSLDQQIDIVTQGCSESFINLLRKLHQLDNQLILYYVAMKMVLQVKEQNYVHSNL